MKAVVVARVGGPEVLEIRDMPEPIAQPGEVIVRVEAVGVNFADTMSTRGVYKSTPPPPFISGSEFAGVVEGSNERVMGYAQYGAAAEKIAVSRKMLWPQPKGWTSEQSAAFPVNFFTAYLAYWKAGMTSDSIEPVYVEGDRQRRVLIHAVAGGVGTAARANRQVASCRDLRHRVIGRKARPRYSPRSRLRHQLPRSQDYEERIHQLTNGEGVDAVFEMLGGEHTAKSLRCCRDFGRVIIYGTATGERQKFDVGAMMARGLSAHGLWLSFLANDHA